MWLYRSSNSLWTKIGKPTGGFLQTHMSTPITQTSSWPHDGIMWVTFKSAWAHDFAMRIRGTENTWIKTWHIQYAFKCIMLWEYTLNRNFVIFKRDLPSLHKTSSWPHVDLIWVIFRSSWAHHEVLWRLGIVLTIFANFFIILLQYTWFEYAHWQNRKWSHHRKKMAARFADDMLCCVCCDIPVLLWNHLICDIKYVIIWF